MHILDLNTGKSGILKKILRGGAAAPTVPAFESAMH